MTQRPTDICTPCRHLFRKLSWIPAMPPLQCMTILPLCSITQPANMCTYREEHNTNRRNLYKRAHELQLIAIRKAPLWKAFFFRLSKVRRETYFFFSIVTFCLLGSGGGLVLFTGIVPQTKHKCDAMRVIAGWLADLMEILGYTAGMYFGVFTGIWLWFIGLIMRAVFKSGKFCRQSYGLAPMIVDIAGEGGLAWLRLYMLLLACMWYKRSTFLDGDLKESKLTPAEIQAVNSIFMYLPPLSPPKEEV
jgi:hypothetical protein